MANVYDFTVLQGSTFNPTLKYSQPQLVVKPITGITKSGQAVVTATHALTIDWPVWVVGVVGMAQINHESADLAKIGKAYQAYYVNSASLRLNLDSSRFNAYASGGELLYHPPVDLSGCTARLQMRATIGDPVVLESLTTENGGITLGGTNGLISLLMTAAATAAIAWDDAVYDLEIIDGSGVVTRLISGSILVSDEVTR